MLKIIRYWLPVAICMGFIFYASSVPGKDIPPLFIYQDLVFHLLVYMMLAYFFSRALKNTTAVAVPKIFMFALIFGIIYGLSDEIHQAFVPYRTVSAFDVFTDAAGAFIGSLIHKWLV